MAGSAGVEQVFPRPGGASPAPGAGGSTSGGAKGVRLGQRELMIGGAVAVVGLALLSRSRAGGDVSPDDDEDASAGTFELDTRDTDLYNELQPELEAISDRLDGIARPPAPAPKPAPPKPKPTPAQNIPYVIRRGDTLNSIARRYRTTRTRLWTLNRVVLDSVARTHKKKSSNQGRILYPGTTIRVPKPKTR